MVLGGRHVAFFSPTSSFWASRISGCSSCSRGALQQQNKHPMPTPAPDDAQPGFMDVLSRFSMLGKVPKDFERRTVRLVLPGETPRFREERVGDGGDGRGGGRGRRRRRRSVSPAKPELSLERMTRCDSYSWEYFQNTETQMLRFQKLEHNALHTRVTETVISVTFDFLYEQRC